MFVQPLKFLCLIERNLDINLKLLFYVMIIKTMIRLTNKYSKIFNFGPHVSFIFLIKSLCRLII